jgi:hypothetical protein
MKNTSKIIICAMAAIFALSVSCKKENKDTTAPSISILGVTPYTVGQGTTYTDPGATAYDETDGDISASITTTNNVSTIDTGYYHVTYNVSDKAGNAAEEKTRTVHVIFM